MILLITIAVYTNNIWPVIVSVGLIFISIFSFLYKNESFGMMDKQLPPFESVPLIDEIKVPSINARNTYVEDMSDNKDMDDSNIDLAKKMGSKDKVAIESYSRLDTESFKDLGLYKRELDEDYANGRRDWWGQNDE